MSNCVLFGILILAIILFYKLKRILNHIPNNVIAIGQKINGFLITNDINNVSYIEDKPVKSRPLTVAKNKLRKNLPVGKFREFALEYLNVVKLNGETLELA